ncbi:glycosyl hydrolase family 8 [Paenibacillus sp. 2TAB26]
MHSRNKRKKSFQVMTCILLTFIMLTTTFSNFVAAADEPAAVSNGAEKVAEWIFPNEGDNGISIATGGAYGAASLFQNVGGTFEYYSGSNKDLSYQGWSGDFSQKYWLATISTKGYKNLTLSSEQTSSGSGPRDFKLQMSTDRATWTDVPNGAVKMTKGVYSCPPNDECKLKNVAIPSEANDQELLYLRWVVSSGQNTNGNSDGIGGGGSSKIRNILVQGERIDNSAIRVPTIDLVKLPKDKAENVSVDAPLTVKFNKAISLDTASAVSIVDNENKPLAGVSLEVVGGNTLNINHPEFSYGKTYTISVPKSLIKGTDEVTQIRDLVWSFSIQQSPFLPKMINMTFNGDPKTSIALAWYTDTMTDSVVQVVEASKMSGNVFPADGVVSYKGTAEEIQTFMTEADRDSNTFTKFISHKAIARELKPGTDYKFRVGNGEEGSWSIIGSFTTDTAANQPFRFIAGSDSQASNKSDFEPWADTFRKAVDYTLDPKFLISAGDLVDNGDLEEQWQWMLGLAQDSLTNVPYVPVLGGHEVNDYDGDVTTPNNNFYNHFNLPKQTVAGTDEGSVYSFEYGDALFMVFNSQYEGGLAANGKDVEWADKEFWDQVKWMQNTVAKSDKKWKFVTFHKGPYGAGDNSAQWEDERVQFYKKYLIPEFDEMGIDMVFEAHDHMYMRSFQMLNDEIIKDFKIDEEGNAIDPKGTVYLMSNAFGNKFYEKNNQHYIDENGDAQEVKDENGNPIPYDDYFAEIDTQPFKKMFTDVSISDKVLAFTAFTAAVADEKAENTVGKGLKAYDDYGIRRTDTKPEKVENVKVKVEGDKAILSWKKPSTGTEPVRGFRIYEKNDKVAAHWSEYISATGNQTDYSLEIKDINPNKKYDFIVKAVGTRDNSAPVEVTTIENGAENEPPSAPTNLTGKAVSPYQNELTWAASSGNIIVAGYNVYRDGVKVGATSSSKLSYSDTGLAANSTYTYEVKAINQEGLESLASHSISLKTKPAAAGEGPFKAFPQHTAYADGTIKPNHITQADMDNTVSRLYDEWKTKYLKENPYTSGQYYVWYADGDWFEENEITVSEAHGYGMLITALMAGHDKDAKKYFDGMYRYFRAHPSEINPDLMAWQQADNGKAIIDINGVDSATDGDMDIAYALLLASEQWGNDGEIDYLAQARKVIKAIMDSEVNQKDWVLRIADWATSGEYENATRPSDFMLQHMKDFAVVSGDDRWNQVVDKTYNVMESLYKNFSPNAGLLPDFVVKDTDSGSFVPAPPSFLESDTDGDYSYNSSRTPWRIGTDYLITGEKRAKDQLSTLNEWIRKKTDNDPQNILAGYKLDGSEAIADYQDITFSAPLMVSAMIDSSNQEWLNKLWDHNTAVKTEDDLYFGNNLRLLSMIVVSGNWWTPTIVDTDAPTDPSNLKAEAGSSTQINLTWSASTDNLGVAGYKVFRNGIELATTTSTSYSDTGLSSETAYQYYVIAFDHANNFSKASNARNITTPKAPTGGNSGGGTGITEIVSTNGKATIPAGYSAKVSLGEKIKVTIPAGATAQEIILTIEELLDTAKLFSKDDIPLSSVFEVLKNSSGKFSKNVTLVFEFNSSLLKENQTAAVFYFDETSKKWVSIGGKINGNKIEVEVDHFTKFAVMAINKNQLNFKDIDGHWAQLNIQKAVAEGFVNGYSDGTFKPNISVTRAEFAVMMMQMLKPQTSGSELQFKDKSAIGAWAVKAVAQAVEAGILTGYEDGSFRPNASISRAEMVAMIAKVTGLDADASGKTGFADDSAIPAWAKKAAETAKKQGIVQGRSGNKFEPTGVATRAEAVTVLLKLKEVIGK